MGAQSAVMLKTENLSRVTVEILGDSYVIKGQAEHGYIADVARIVDTRMRELAKTSRSHSKTKLAVLTAINLVDELLQLKGGTVSSLGDSSDELSRRTEQLITLLDEGLIGDTFYAE